MRKPKILNHQDMRVIMRKDFYDHLGSHLKKITEETGIIYFGHNIIKNYGERDHRVSTFCNYEKWHDLYWEKYCHKDPMEKIVHQMTNKSNFGATSWEMGEGLSLCSKERISLTKAKGGLCFSFKRPENHIESFTIGWNNLNANEMSTEYILYLCSMLKPLKDHHWQVHDKV
jgi:hypothetical protein